VPGEFKAQKSRKRKISKGKITFDVWQHNYNSNRLLIFIYGICETLGTHVGFMKLLL
jgi:hypothetical protein